MNLFSGGGFILLGILTPALSAAPAGLPGLPAGESLRGLPPAKREAAEKKNNEVRHAWLN